MSHREIALAMIEAYRRQHDARLLQRVARLLRRPVPKAGRR